MRKPEGEPADDVWGGGETGAGEAIWVGGATGVGLEERVGNRW